MDFAAYGLTNATTVEAAWGIDPHTVGNGYINVALVLGRANDPTSLLNSDWATRQTTIATLNASGTLWSTYGADQTLYNAVVSDLQSLHIPVIGDAAGSDGYISSAQSRTIWVSLNSTTFQALFGAGAALHRGTTSDGYTLDYWTGSLSLPSEWNVVGIGVDGGATPNPQNLAQGASVTLTEGRQSLGNWATQQSHYFPNQIADAYNFPLAGTTVATGTIGLIEPSTGDALTGHNANDAATTAAFQAALDAYRQRMGYTTPGSFYTVANNGQTSDSGSGGERSLDVGVVAGAAPQSTIGLYSGSGINDVVGGNGKPARGSVYTTNQAAFWDTTNNPEIVSSSFTAPSQSSPGSPFLLAMQELYVDAALRNITSLSAAGDGGSSSEIANGLANLHSSHTSPYGLLVGGTSLSTADAAATDSTLAALLQEVQSGDLGTIWRLISGGLMTLPSSGTNGTFVESTWNKYVLKGKDLYPAYDENNSGTGGVDPTQPTPWYQTAYGLTPTSSAPVPQVGRGSPDVSINAGGNMAYVVPDADMQGAHPDGGTSAAAPLWAALYAQFNAIFRDQHLPNLGYSNDLLYIASAVAPGSFNDLTYGNNISSFAAHGPIRMAGYGDGITPTGFGYSAGPGYDLATGLGSPNGVLLARALTSIAHAQMYFDTPAVLGQSVGGAWAAPVTESLLFQPVLSSATHVDLALGGNGYGADPHASATYAWTNQFAQQVLQSDFSSQLVTLFDAQSQATPFQATAQAGANLQLQLGGAGTTAPQATLTAPYGFVDFTSADHTAAVQVARPVSVAETAGGANDVDAVVRLRQVGTSNVELMLYKVDDYSGTVDGRAPGQAGYEAAAQAHAYQTNTGSTWIAGPGFGVYGQTEIAHVNAGDLIAMALKANGHTYYAFTSANADGVTHLWNYGLNTYGWEDLYGGGDQDYNDLVVQLDFTSTAGHGYLV